MQIRKIYGKKAAEFNEVWRIYRAAFPSDERRTEKSEKEAFKKKGYSLYAAYEGSALFGFIEAWRFPDFQFIEHFAVKEKMRGKGLGARLMKKFIGGKKKQIVIEVELPRSGAQKRRISFYKRLGFKLNKYRYIQLSYGRGKKAIQLQIMSYPEKIRKKKFSKIRKKIYSGVYGINPI